MSVQHVDLGITSEWMLEYARLDNHNLIDCIIDTNLNLVFIIPNTTD